MGNQLRKPFSDAVTRRRKAAADALALLGMAPALPSPGDVCEVSVVCAVHDAPYRLRFVRQASGLFRFSEAVKDTGNGGGASGGAWAGVKDISVPVDELEPGPTPCPWCGNGSFHFCVCQTFVCGGRMTGSLFRCRDSCGAEWVGTPMTEISAAMPRPDWRHFQAPSPARRHALNAGDAGHRAALPSGGRRLALPRPSVPVKGGTAR